jgi:hypothetical protein
LKLTIARNVLTIQEEANRQISNLGGFVSGLVSQWWRLGGVSGILFLVVFIIGSSFQSEPPAYGDPTDEIRAFWVEEGGDYLTGDYVIGLAFILFFYPFVSALTGVLGAAEGGVRFWSRIAFGGAVLFMALAGLAGASWTALAFGDVAENASDETIELLMALDVGAAHFLPAGLAIMTLPAAVAMFTTRALPLWLAVLTLVLGVLAAIAPASILAENPSDSVLGFLPFVGSAVWILATSVTLIVRKDAPVVAAGVLA